MWVCWDAVNEKVCHCASDVKIGHTMDAKMPNDGLVKLNFEGAYGHGAELNVRCNLSSIQTDSIEIEGSIEFEWENDKVVVRTESEVVCARAFQPLPSPAPYTTPTPTPVPHVDVNFSASFTDAAGKSVSLDLHQMKDHVKHVVAGYNKNYDRILIAFHPVDPKPAPEGYTVLDTENSSNLWRCAGTWCHSLGHAKFNMTIALYNASDADHGIMVRYYGGYGGYYGVVIFQCNESVDDVWFDDVASLTPSRMLAVFAHTKQLCPKVSPDIRRRGKISGGAVFLLVIASGFLVYSIGGMMFIWLRGREVRFPNNDFWCEFWNCTVSAVVFLLCCGKGGKKSYDTL
jgi:hypothetical protein